MKKHFALLILTILPFFLFSQESEDIQNTALPSNKLTIDGGPFQFIFDEGISFAQVTRIEEQNNRSNFVRETMMAGAFFSFQTINLAHVDLVEQISAYYPLYYAFNGMQQFPKNMFNFAIDSFTGITKTYYKIKYFNINLSLGMHYMFQLTDEWPMSYLGLGLKGTLEFPLTKNWTIINNYFFSYDNPNIGPNKLMQPFEASYQYHIDIGIRFSRKVENSYCYIKPKSLK